MEKDSLKKLILIIFFTISLCMLSYGVAKAGWTVMESFPIRQFEAIWGSSGTDVYAMSNFYIYCYDGETWSKIYTAPTPDPSLSVGISDIWGTSPNDIIVVGEDILHYDGTNWSPMPTSEQIPAPFGVWGNASDDVFAVGGDGIISHYDGLEWSPIRFGTTERLFDVWGSSPSDIFVVGADHFSSTFGEGSVILHYDSSQWSSIDSGTENRLFGWWEGSVILHYDGAQWSSMDSGTETYLYGVWGSSANDVFAVGLGGVILHYDGSTWSLMDSGTSYNLFDVWGSSPSDIFVVGGDLDTSAVILHYDGVLPPTTSTTTSTADSTTIPSSTTTSTTNPPCLTETLYGEHSEQTELLRYYRDNVLSKTNDGQELIRLYYEWSPVIVKAMEEDKAFKVEVREMIDIVLEVLKEEDE